MPTITRKVIVDHPAQAMFDLVDGVEAWQLYYYRGNAWTNAQSSGDRANPRGNGTGELDTGEDLPDGIRLVVTTAGGTLTRDLIVPPQPQ